MSGSKPATASSLALDDAFGVTLTDNGRIARNLILGANFIQSNILQFYHLAALDYVNGPDTAPFIPRYKNNDIRVPKDINDAGVAQYLEALEIRKICHEMVALLGGKMPHVQGIVVGGTTEIPTREALNAYAERFKSNHGCPRILQATDAFPSPLTTAPFGSPDAKPVQSNLTVLQKECRKH